MDKHKQKGLTIMTELKARKDMDPAYQWDFTPIYPDLAAWEAELTALTAELDTVKALKGTLRVSAEGLKAGGIVAMKDPTRGGLANTLNEWCSKSHIGMEIDYADIPLREGVVSACDLLGIDPLSIGN